MIRIVKKKIKTVVLLCELIHFETVNFSEHLLRQKKVLKLMLASMVYIHFVTSY